MTPYLCRCVHVEMSYIPDYVYGYQGLAPGVAPYTGPPPPRQPKGRGLAPRGWPTQSPQPPPSYQYPPPQPYPPPPPPAAYAAPGQYAGSAYPPYQAQGAAVMEAQAQQLAQMIYSQMKPAKEKKTRKPRAKKEAQVDELDALTDDQAEMLLEQLLQEVADKRAPRAVTAVPAARGPKPRMPPPEYMPEEEEEYEEEAEEDEDVEDVTDYYQASAAAGGGGGGEDENDEDDEEEYE